MAMKIARTGSAAVVGVASAAIEKNTTPITLGTTKISWGTVVEGVAFVGGAAMQLFSPNTMPDVVDGLVDGGAALLAARGTRFALAQMQPAAAPFAAAGGYATPIGALAGGNGAAPMYSRPAVGGISSVSPKRTLT